MQRLPASIEKLLHGARRRCFLRLWGRSLLIGSSVLFVGAVAFLLIASKADFRSQAISIQSALFLTRLTWLSALLGSVVALSAILAGWLVPKRIGLALALDHSFHLKERITTLLSLDEKTAATPAGQTLLADTEERVSNLDLQSAYSLTPSRWSGLLPLLLIGCVAAILFCESPIKATGTASANDAPLPPDQKEAVAQAIDDFKNDAPPVGEGNVVTSEDLQDLQPDFDKLVQDPPKTQQEARDRVEKATDVLDRLRKKAKQLEEAKEAFRKQMEQMDRLSKRKQQEGPGSDVQNSLDRGDFEQAREDARRLSRKLQNGDLTEEQKKALQDQLQDLEEKLSKMTDEKLQREELENLKDAGKVTAEELKEALEQMKKNAENLSKEEIEELKEQLKKAKEALNEDEKVAAKALAKAGEKLGKMSNKVQKDQIAARIRQVKKLQLALGKAAGGSGIGRGSGKRPQGEERKTDTVDSRIRGQRENGALTGVRHVPGRGVKLPLTAGEKQTVIQEAERAAAEALERQQISPAGEEITRKYFENLRKSKR